MDHATPLKSGTLLGRFRIDGLAGHGGMGDVYMAFDTALERRVALKRLRFDANDPVALARFRREAQSLAQLNHPCVCQVYDFTETEAGLFIAMEWVEGDTLPDLMGWPRKPVPPRKVQGIVKGIAQALAAAHAKGIVHRDLKPSNVMVGKDGGVKVLDFGLAKGSAEDHPPVEPPPIQDPAKAFLAAARGEASPPPDPHSQSSAAWDPLTQVGHFMGTPGYASPEQARGKWVTPASDVFGLGILTHELLTGLRPFPGDGEAQLRAVVQNQRVEVVHPKGAWKLWHLMERMLAPSVKQRPSAQEVAEALEAMERPISGTWWALSAATAAVMLVSAFWWMRGRGVIADLSRERPARIAVLRIHNSTGDPKLDAVVQSGLPELLAAALHSSPRLSVIDADALRSVASSLKVDPQNASDADLSRLGAALGASLMLTGEVNREIGHHQDLFHLTLKDRNGKVRYEGIVTQPQRVGFLPQALLYPAVDRLLKAVDPWGGEESVRARPSIPEALFTSYSEGMSLVNKGDYGKAEPLLAEAAYGAPDFAQGVGAYAVCLRYLGKDQAGPTNFWAIYAARQAGDRNAEAFGLSALATWAMEKRDLDRASTAFTRALELAESSHDLDRQSTILNGMGRLAYSRGDVPSARADYEKSLALAQQMDNRLQQAQVLTNLANISLGAGDLHQAEQLYRQILKIAEEIGDQDSQALALNNLGVVLLTQRRVEEAQAPLSRALEIRHATHAVTTELSSQRNLGIYHLMKGEFDLAEARFRLSLNLALDTKNPYGTAKALFYLGETDIQRERFDAARASLDEAATLFGTTSSAVPRAECLAGAALCMIRKADRSTPESGRLLKEATGISPYDPFVMRGQAWEAFVEGRPAEALALVDKALADPGHVGPEIQKDLLKARQRFFSPRAGH